MEPEAASQASQPPTPNQEVTHAQDPFPTTDNSEYDPAVNTPIPDDNADDDLCCEGLYCVDQDVDPCYTAEEVDLAWKCEV